MKMLFAVLLGVASGVSQMAHAQSCPAIPYAKTDREQIRIGITEVARILIRQHFLAVEAAALGADFSVPQRSALNNEYQALTGEITRIGQSASIGRYPAPDLRLRLHPRSKRWFAKFINGSFLGLADGSLIGPDVPTAEKNALLAEKSIAAAISQIVACF